MNGTLNRDAGPCDGRMAAPGVSLTRWLLALCLGLLLAACGGGGGGDAAREDAPASTDTARATLSGVAATGAAVQGIVTLKDIPTGQVQATHTDDGRYTFNVTGLAGPFLLSVEADDHAPTLYSLALKTGSVTHAHLNPLSHRIMAQLAGQPMSWFPLSLAMVFRSPGDLVFVDAEALHDATQAVLLRTSPYFRGRLQAHGVDLATLDPVAGPYVIGQGLDLAFDEVRFFLDEVTGDAWETSVATGAVVGGGKQAGGSNTVWGFYVDAGHDYLIPGASQALVVTAQTGYWTTLPVRHGVRWELSDDSLATIDASGVVTARAFTGRHTLTVTGYFQQGDELLQDAVTLTLVDQPDVESVVIDLPDTVPAATSQPLYTRVQFNSAAGSGTVTVAPGSWRLVDPDPYVSAHVRIDEWGSASTLVVGSPPMDLSVRLRAEQTIAGYAYVTEKVITVPRFVRLPTSFQLYCPSYLEYNVAATCRGYVRYNDGAQETVAPTLSVSAADAGVLAASGATLTSAWGERNNWRYVTVTGEYQGMTAQQSISLNPRKTLMTALEIIAVDTMPEFASTTLQAWASWSDGSRSDVTSSVKWASSDTALAYFPWSYSSTLQSNYILDQTADKVATLTAWSCSQPSYGCAEADRLVASKGITVRSASLTLVGVDLGTGVIGSGFAEQGKTYPLTARAIWNKKRPDGSPFMTDIAAGVEWSSNHAAAVVSGDSLTVGSLGDEPLAMVTARYRDPGDAGVQRTARRVITLYTALGTPRRLSQMWIQYGAGTTYVLGGDGLARPLQTLDWTQGGRHVQGAPESFMAQVKQVVRTEHGLAFLHQDGSVWYPEPVASLPFSAEMREQIVRQTGYFGPVVPRRIPGLGNVVSLAQTSAYYFSGALFALQADGAVKKIAITPSSSGRLYKVTGWRAGVSRIESGRYLHLVLSDGTVERRTDLFYDNTSTVLKADGSPLTGVVEVAPLPAGGMARTSDGTIWTWGLNHLGQLGLGDNTNRDHASPITSVTGFSQLATMLPAALRSDGTLWQWGLDSQPASTLPQQVTGLGVLTAVQGSHVVDSDGKVWWWGRNADSSYLSTPLPVLLEGREDAAQLSLP